MSEKEQKQFTGESRREFLRKSAYAAYATPVIVSMLVNKANAAKSWNPGKGKVTETGSASSSAASRAAANAQSRSVRLGGRGR